MLLSKLFRSCHCRFLEQCDHFGLLGHNEKAALLDAKAEGPLNSATRRAQKVANFRLEKAAKAKLDALKLQVGRQ